MWHMGGSLVLDSMSEHWALRCQGNLVLDFEFRAP